MEDDSAALLAAQVVLASDAVAAVLADLHRTTELRPDIAVDVWMEGGIRITVDNGYTAPSMWATERAEALAEVATYLQDQLDLGKLVEGRAGRPVRMLAGVRGPQLADARGRTRRRRRVVVQFRTRGC